MAKAEWAEALNSEENRALLEEFSEALRERVEGGESNLENFMQNIADLQKELSGFANYDGFRDDEEKIFSDESYNELDALISYMDGYIAALALPEHADLVERLEAFLKQAAAIPRSSTVEEDDVLSLGSFHASEQDLDDSPRTVVSESERSQLHLQRMNVLDLSRVSELDFDLDTPILHIRPQGLLTPHPATPRSIIPESEFLTGYSVFSRVSKMAAKKGTGKLKDLSQTTLQKNFEAHAKKIEALNQVVSKIAETQRVDAEELNLSTAIASLTAETRGEYKDIIDTHIERDPSWSTQAGKTEANRLEHKLNTADLNRGLTARVDTSKGLKLEILEGVDQKPFITETFIPPQPLSPTAAAGTTPKPSADSGEITITLHDKTDKAILKGIELAIKDCPDGFKVDIEDNNPERAIKMMVFAIAAGAGDKFHFDPSTQRAVDGIFNTASLKSPEDQALVKWYIEARDNDGGQDLKSATLAQQAIQEWEQEKFHLETTPRSTRPSFK